MEGRYSPKGSSAPDFRVLFESVPCCCVVLDATLVIVAASDAYLIATRTTRETLLGRPLLSVFPEDEDDGATAGDGSLRSSLDRTLRLRRADVMPVEKLAIQSSDGSGGVIERVFRRANHPVLGPDGKVVYVIHQVENLTEGILDISCMEPKGIPVTIEAVDVLDVLSDVFDILAPAAQEAGVRIEVAPGLVGVPRIRADRTRFAQILLTFASNGVKPHCRDGVVTFSLSWREEDGLVRVRVTNTAQRIRALQQASSLQPPLRALGSLEGSGVGLELSKRLAEAMGGSVGARGVSGEDSEFWVDLPIFVTHSRSTFPPPLELDKARRWSG
jgi:signal transduction histidine kinase